MPDDTPILRQFSQVLQSIEDGQFHQDCSDELDKARTTLVNHMLDHGGEPSATLTLKFKLKVQKGVMAIKPELSLQLPKAPRSTAVLYMTDKGLTPFNPKQMEMFGGSPKVVSEKSEIKQI